MKVLQFFFCYLHLCFFYEMNTNCFCSKKNKAGKENQGPEGPGSSLCLNLALTSFSCSREELFVSVSLEGGQLLFFCCPPCACRVYRAHKWLFQGCGWAAERRVGSRDPRVPSVRAHKRTCTSGGWGQALLGSCSPWGIWAASVGSWV